MTPGRFAPNGFRHLPDAAATGNNDLIREEKADATGKGNGKGDATIIHLFITFLRLSARWPIP